MKIGTCFMFLCLEGVTYLPLRLSYAATESHGAHCIRSFPAHHTTLMEPMVEH